MPLEDGLNMIGTEGTFDPVSVLMLPSIHLASLHQRRTLASLENHR